jgi:hypothetical protein
MNDNLKQAIDFSNKMLSIKVQKQYLREKFSADTTHGHGGGIFKIDTHLLLFVESLVNQKRIEDVILLDSNQTPIVIHDLLEFQKEIVSKYWSAVGFYQAGYEDLKKRKIESVRLALPKI